MSFLRSKKFWLTLIALIIIGLLIYSVFFRDQGAGNGTVPSNGIVKEGDNNPPASQIRSPLADSWHGKDFAIELFDEDLESGLDNSSCEIKILTYDNGKEYSTGWMRRKCNYDLTISVGQGKMCGFEGRGACWIYIRSKDRNGNQHNSSLDDKSIIYLNIDWTNPSVGKIFTDDQLENQIYPISIEEGEEYNFKAQITDNIRVTGCNLYINDQDQGIMLSLNPGCEKKCIFQEKFIPEQSGTYQVFAACKDVAGNISKSETIEAKTNLPPQISSCRVEPTTGDSSSQFNFLIEVIDPDNDPLSFYWDFGDEEFSNSKDPIHSYKTPGTYKPSIIVSDNHGVSESCSTAWVTIVQ